MGNPAKPLEVGRTYGMLTVLGNRVIQKFKRPRLVSLCRCACGKEVEVVAAVIRFGDRQDCGCQQKVKHKAAVTTHGLSYGREYRTWDGMRRRCRNPNNAGFKDYGGRGITVCDRWLVFENFYQDMGAKPKGLTLERVDNNKGYEPGNCVWTTHRAQANNRRSCRYLTFNGETLTCAEWARRKGMPRCMLWSRLRKWSVEKALTTPRRAK